MKKQSGQNKRHQLKKIQDGIEKKIKKKLIQKQIDAKREANKANFFLDKMKRRMKRAVKKETMSDQQLNALNFFNRFIKDPNLSKKIETERVATKMSERIADKVTDDMIQKLENGVVDINDFQPSVEVVDEQEVKTSTDDTNL